MGFFVFSFAGTSHAANTGTLAGIVRDGGNPLPGATVQIASTALIGGPRVAVSDADGRFAFYLLPVGTYTVEVVLVGFRPGAGEVRVMSSRVGAITFQMVPEAFSGEIDVTADVPVVDTAQVNAGVVFDENFLQLAGVGTANRYYQQVLAQAPGVAGGNNPSVFGSTFGENSYLIDGMNTTDPRSGTWAAMISMDAVQEMNFQLGGFEAEFGQATGGLVNLVTKSGGNQFTGSFDARFRGKNFTESGEHYDPDELQEWRQQYSASLGGPLLRDRLWFFTSLQYIDYSRREVDAHFNRQWTGWQFIGKMTWQASQSNRMVFKYQKDPAEIPGVNMGRFTLESAMQTQEQGGDMFHLELNSVLSESWLLVGQVGTHSSFTAGFPTNVPTTLSGHSNEDTGLAYNSSGWFYDAPRLRREARLHGTWFVDNLAGAHEFKGGLEYNRVGYDEVSYATGGGWVTDHTPNASIWAPEDLNGDGYFNHSVTVQEPADRVKDEINSSGDLAAVFVQDSWRPVPDLTLKLGLRLDRSTHDNQAGERIADMRLVQPRLGVAWDLLGNARHVLRGSVGRFMDPTSLMLPSFASGVDGTFDEYNTLEYLCNSTYGRFCTVDSLPPSYGDPYYWTNWAGQEYTLYGSTSSPSSAQTVDQLGVGRLKAPYADELIIAYEAQLARETSIELSYVNKSTRDMIEDTCSGNTWVYGDGEIPSLDDPSTWTHSYECNYWLIANMPGQKRDYEAWIVRFEGRRGWGHLMASYTYSDSRMNSFSGTGHYAFGDFDYFPVHFHNVYGRFDRPHRVKLNGYLLLPKRFTIGIDGFWSSAALTEMWSTCESFRTAGNHRSTEDQMTGLGIDPETVAYCTTPDGQGLDTWIIHSPGGSIETKSVWQLDVQISKAFRVGNTDLQAIVTVYNLFSHEWDKTFNRRAFLQDTDEDNNGLHYQDDDPTAPYYDEDYGADGSPVLVPILEPLSYWDPRRYEIGFRIEF
jgi:hypothetical protein